MFDLIDFCLANSKNIQDYEVEYYDDNDIIVTFIMKNGDKNTFFVG